MYCTTNSQYMRKNRIDSYGKKIRDYSVVKIVQRRKQLGYTSDVIIVHSYQDTYMRKS